MPESGDLELILLKGHLLIEEVLTAIINAGIRKPAVLEAAKIPFAMKQKIARAVIPGTDMPLLWEAVSSVNTARNALAHGLEPDRTVKTVRSFISLVERQQPDLDRWLSVAKESDIPLLAHALYCVYHELINVSGVRITRRNQLLAEALMAHMVAANPSRANSHER